MARLINVVGTRIAGGDFAAARRWYADHVHQLLGFAGLQGAALYQRGPAVDGDAAPQMLCCYDFGDAAAFAAYEASEVKRAAERDRQAGWGRDGIAICMRAPYERLYATARDAAEPDWPAQCGITRWTGAASAVAERLLCAAAFEREAAQHVMLRAAAGDGYLWFESPSRHASPPASSAPVELAPAWHGTYRRLHAWRR